MTPRRFAAALLVFAVSCGGTLKTGTAKKPVTAKPADDGSCPSGQSVCGTGAFAVCVDLQNDANHCGTCAHACSPGIACQAGLCQQTRCSGSSIPVTPQVAVTAPAWGNDYAAIPVELLADVNGDGRLDLVDVQHGGGFGAPAELDLTSFRVSLGQPTGGFAAAATYHAAFDISTISTTDANNDGVDDLIVFSNADHTRPPCRMQVWLGHPDGTLTLSSATEIDA